MSILIQSHNLSVSIDSTPLLQHIDIALQESELVGLIGPNGAGKSTLLRSLAGLQEPSEGEVIYSGVPSRKVSARDRAKRIAFLGQHAQLNWPLNVYQTVMLGRHPHRGMWSTSKHQDHAAVQQALELTKTQPLAQRRVDSLSGGERMRVYLARALAVQANVLLADEPLSGLDPYHQFECMDVMRKQADQQSSVLMVLHDITLASRFCDRVFLLNAGELVAQGSPQEVLTQQRLRDVYDIESHHGDHAGRSFVLPWRVTREAGG